MVYYKEHLEWCKEMVKYKAWNSVLCKDYLDSVYSYEEGVSGMQKFNVTQFFYK